jgi:hypothetical protein
MSLNSFGLNGNPDIQININENEANNGTNSGKINNKYQLLLSFVLRFLVCLKKVLNLLNPEYKYLIRIVYHFSLRGC